MERLTVAEAARRLGVTQDAVRQRIRRATIEHDKDPNGRTYVYLSPEDTRRDGVRDASHDALVEELRDRIRYLEEESRRKDAILMTMAQRIPELEPASAPRESPTEATEDDGRGEGGEGTEGPSRRSWYRRILGL